MRRANNFSLLDSHQDIFRWKELSIIQQDDVFRIGTDAILLGAWIPLVIQSAKTILDVGTGTGILALMMNSAYPGAEIISIDDNEKAAVLAGENFRKANAGNRIKVRHQSLFNFTSEGCSFDLIVCNPPYYFDHLVAQKEVMRSAKHSGASIKSWMESFNRLLKDEGCLCLVLPHETASEWIKYGNEFGLYVKEKMDVYSFIIDDRPARSLINLQRVLVKPNFSRLHIYNTDHQYTDEYIKFSGINPGGR